MRKSKIHVSERNTKRERKRVYVSSNYKQTAMSEEESRKRGRDEDDGYDVRDRMEQDGDGYGEEADALPPHMMMGDDENDGGETAVDSGNAGKTENLESGSVVGAVTDRPEGHTHKRQRRAQLSVEIEQAYEQCFQIGALGDQKHDTLSILQHTTENMSLYWGEEDYYKNMLVYLGAVFTEMPHKSFHLSGLVLLGSVKKERIGSDTTAWIKSRIEEVFAAINGEDVDVGEDSEKQMSAGLTWNRVVLCLRMLALLTPVIADVGSVIGVVKKLLEHAVKLQSVSDRRVGVAELLYNELLLTLPYFVANVKDGDADKEELKSALRECIEVARGFAVRDAADHEYQPVKSDEMSEPFSNQLKRLPDVVDTYLDDMSVFFDVRGMVDPLIEKVIAEKGRTKAEGEESREEMDEIESDIVVEFTKHEIGSFNVPELDKLQDEDVLMLRKFASVGDKFWEFPRYRMKIFSRESTRRDLGLETLPDHGTYESMIIYNILGHFIVNVEYNRVSVSRMILNYTNFFNEKKFSKSNSSLDKLLIIKDMNDKGSEMNLIEMLESNAELDENVKREMIHSAKKIQLEYVEGFASTWKMEEIALETISDFIFVIPSREEDLPLIYFESLIADTCGRDWTLVKKSQANSNESLVFSKLVGDSFRYFYENIEKFEFENIVRFVNWMLMQISNFKFEWEWQEWISDVIQIGEEKIFNPKIFFIKNVIHKEILVTNYKFIRDKTLPKDLKKFVNISLKDREELIEFDSRFFGKEFAEKFSSNPFEAELEASGDGDGNNDDGGDGAEGEEVVETNTDMYKLFTHYLFNHDEHPYNDLCRDIYMNLENVEESEEGLIELLNKLRERISNDEEMGVVNSEEYILTLIVESICLIGSRSFSVFEESLHKVFGDKLRKVIENVEGDEVEKEEWIINGVLRIWNNEPRIGLLFVEKLNKFGVLNSKNIIERVFRLDDNRVLPLSEVYADEYLVNLIERYEGEEREELIKVYFGECERVLELLKGVEVESGEQLDEQSSEEAWKRKNLEGLVKSRQRRWSVVARNK